MAPKSPLNLVFGAGNVGDGLLDPIVRFDSKEEVNVILETFLKRGYNHIDTSRGYSTHAPGTSEARLAAADAGSKFVIDTKVSSREAGAHAANKIASQIDLSLDVLRIDQINIEYLHHPDRATPFEETCEAIDKSYRAGKFKRFGLSNYTAAEVEQFVEICKRRGFVKPSVYQGQYNAIVRSGEKELFPVLRKHNISFYAWSPTAAGFFAGNYKDVKPGGRFDKSHFLGSIYSKLYLKSQIQEATEAALTTGAKFGISGHAAALRWIAYHSILDNQYGDSIILGASSPEQLSSNLDMIEAGPLPDEVAQAMSGLFESIGDVGIPYHL
ncbi:aflatoxin B1 aldehyde reductase member 2 [Beauveria brongniartii RCEF 3172]|uniref:Aflatoxin B1 aldehyde reductase member 2 n=1 Tax=Beauveria brongniartii RCEF 3172 TaxID=1081107 RepID=A0A167AZA0_9HYPO|nr:aflatoxin B1 aldehyde reductase member 2 [Beauveria brongniartii RCEF 3172]